MKVSVSVQGDLNRVFGVVKNSVAVKAARRAFSRTETTLKKEARSIVKSENLRLKAAEINKAVRTEKNTSGQNLSSFSASIQISQKPVPLIRFLSGRPSTYLNSKKRRKVRVNPKGKRSTLQSAFVAQMKSGHIGIYERLQRRRLPIRELYGPSVRDLFKRSDHIRRLKLVGTARFRREFLANVRFFARKEISRAL